MIDLNDIIEKMKNYKVSVLADVVGVHRNTIYKYMNKKVIPRGDHLVKLINFMNGDK